MGATFRFLAVGDEVGAVRSWFDGLDIRPEVVEKAGGALLYFREMGPLSLDADGVPVPKQSPIVTLLDPRLRQGVLWTAGEVHFLPGQRLFPGLDAVGARFRRWLGRLDRVFDGAGGEWDYFLEGSIRNYESQVFALPGAMTALRAGTYFIADEDTDDRVDRLCRSLALRGVNCDEPSRQGRRDS